MHVKRCKGICGIVIAVKVCKLPEPCVYYARYDAGYAAKGSNRFTAQRMLCVFHTASVAQFLTCVT